MKEEYEKPKILSLGGIASAQYPQPHYHNETDKGNKIVHYHITQEGHIYSSTDPRLPKCTKLWDHRKPRLDTKEKKDEIKKRQKKQKEKDPERKKLQALEQVGHATYEYDCHGKTFGCKKIWINNDQVQKILDDGGFKKVEGKAKVGDIVVYKKNSMIIHTGIVHRVDEKGKVVKVQSKWGLGPDWIHDPNDVPPGYGTWTVCRKSKSGKPCCQ
ncbi:MAG: hypothetical protein ACE5J9_10350 [Methanosarcinales archaeon]